MDIAKFLTDYMQKSYTNKYTVTLLAIQDLFNKNSLKFSKIKPSLTTKCNLNLACLLRDVVVNVKEKTVVDFTVSYAIALPDRADSFSQPRNTNVLEGVYCLKDGVDCDTGLVHLYAKPDTVPKNQKHEVILLGTGSFILDKDKFHAPAIICINFQQFPVIVTLTANYRTNHIFE